MLIPVIHFEITDFRSKTTEEYCIKHTAFNQELVLSHRYTRNIEFSSEGEISFAYKMRIPEDFIFNNTYGDEDLLDEIDEMVGVY